VGVAVGVGLDVGVGVGAGVGVAVTGRVADGLGFGVPPGFAVDAGVAFVVEAAAVGAALCVVVAGATVAGCGLSNSRRIKTASPPRTPMMRDTFNSSLTS
jgi:hypothetical protein